MEPKKDEKNFEDAVGGQEQKNEDVQKPAAETLKTIKKGLNVGFFERYFQSNWVVIIKEKMT